MVTFGIISFLVLALIFSFLRSQNLQRELVQKRLALRNLSKQSKFSLKALVLVSNQMQHNYLAKLEAKQKHALINQEEYQILSFILNQLELVIMRCCEHSATVEEALSKALKNSEYSMEDLSSFIAKQPSDVRMSWCKNSIAGFLDACNLLCAQRTENPRSPSRQEKPEAKSSQSN